MITLDVIQGSAEWHAARCGKVTASRVADIMRRTKNGVSAMRQTYLGEVVAERLSGQVDLSPFKSKAMEWGNETEDAARNWYAFMHDCDPRRVGLVIHPRIDMAAASPDRLIGDDGMIEIKCPNSATHIATLRGAPIDPDYEKQIHWQIACTGAQWCDFVSFDPRMPPDMQAFVKRFERNEIVIAEIEKAVTDFLHDVEDTVSELVAKFRQKEAAE